MASRKVANLPVRCRLRFSDAWEVSSETIENGARFTLKKSSRGREFLTDASAVTEQFLSVETAEEAAELLRKYGPFARHSEGAMTHHLVVQECSETLDNIRAHQDAFRGFIQQQSPSWAKERSFDLELEEGGQHLMESLMLRLYQSPVFTLQMGHVTIRARKVPSPFLNFQAEDVSSAVYASIYIDKMRGLRGLICQRPSCSKTFLAGDPRKKYCSDACGAYVRVTAGRTAAKAALNGKA